ncbi:hypothetical protein WJX74_007520 [Apatococcus lobatus]|uniref:Uncharacterized protein n=1 Tax=Apatococcus lobatus TaxID=904363 RepID=A0AAW1RVX2_9CHLO
MLEDLSRKGTLWIHIMLCHVSSSVTFGDTKASAEQAAAQETPFLQSQSDWGDGDAAAHDGTLQESPPSFSQEATWSSHACRLNQTFTHPTDSTSNEKLVSQEKGEPLPDGQSRPATSDCLLGIQARLEGLAQQRAQDIHPKVQYLRFNPPEPPASRLDRFEDALDVWCQKVVDGIEAAAILPASSTQYSSSLLKELAQQVDAFKGYTGEVAHWLDEDITTANEMLKDCSEQVDLQVHLQAVYEKVSGWFAVSHALINSITAFFQDLDLNLYKRMNRTYQKLLRKGNFPSAGGPYATGQAAFAIADRDVSIWKIALAQDLQIRHFDAPLPRIRSFFRAVCSTIAQKKLRPVIQTQYTRTVYDRSDSALVATLDTDQLLFKPAAALHQWFSSPHSWSTRIFQMRPQLEMDVTLADRFSLPDWVGASVTHNFLTEVPSHGYYLPAVLKLFPEQVKIVPPEIWESRPRCWTKCQCVDAALAESFQWAAWDGNPAASSQVILRSSEHIEHHPPWTARYPI